MKKIYQIWVLIFSMASSLSAQTLSTTWLGNSFGYADEKWVQNHVNSLYVAPDGTCFTQSIWDEGHHERGIYKDGDNLGQLVGIGSGLAITGDGTYVYAADGNETCYQIRRFNVSDFGYSPGGDILLPANTKVYDLAVKNGKLYASDPNNNRVLIYNTTDGSAAGSFSVTRPADLTIDNNGNIWIVQSAYSFAGEIPTPNAYIAAPKILCYSSTGVKQSREITDVVEPTDLTIDNNGRLLVADNGPDLQIRGYTNLNTTPILDNTFFNGGKFGQQGGVYAGTRGLNAPDKFYKLAGVGVDGAGNIYVNLGGPSPKGNGPLMDTDLRKFNTLGQQQWQLMGKEFVDMGDLDPADDTKFYTKDSKYSLDWSKTAPSAEWKYESVNIDPYRYPGDPRAKVAGSPDPFQAIENVFTRRINGQLFMYGNSMAGDQGYMWVFRFKSTTDGEIAIPAACIGTYRPGDTWPVGLAASTSDYEFLWRDLNGNGKWDAGEYTTNPITEFPWCNGSWPDENGNLWRAYRGEGIRKLICSGVDANGVPQYNFASRILYSKPVPMTDVHYVRYFPATDEMYLAGWTINNNSPGDYPGQIHSIVKYTSWSTTPVKAWESPSSLYTELNTAQSFDIAGDYIFTVYTGRDGATVPPWNGTVYVYKRSDGTKVTSFSPGAEVGSACGWVDIWDGGIRARKRANGEYAIFIEDDAHNKTIIYRWNPTAVNVQVTGVSVSPTTKSIAVNTTTQLTATVAPSNATNKNASWSSSSPTVATVNTTGLVTGVAAGYATITVTTADGAKTASCVVTVTSSGTTTILNDHTTGSDNYQFEFVGNWNSETQTSNYNNDGTWGNGNNSTDFYQVRFFGTQVKVYSKTSNNQSIVKISIDGGTETNVDTYSPSVQYQTLIWASAVLTPGQHTLKVRASNTKNASSSSYYTYADRVDVINGSATIPVTSVTVSPTTASLAVNATTQLTATIAPSNATNITVTWSSSNTSIATVNTSGLVTAVAAGSATITATTVDGAKTAISAITVTPSSYHVYNFSGINAANNDYDVFLCDVDVFPFGGSTANRNSMVEATNAQYINVSAIDGSSLLTVNPGTGDEMFVWSEMKITEAVSAISQIDFTYNGYTNGSTSTHQIYVLKAGQPWETSASWVKVGADQIFPASNTTMTCSITSNIADYIDANGQIIWGIYETTSNQPERVNYIGMTVKYNPANSARIASINENLNETIQPSVKVFPNPVKNSNIFIQLNGYEAMDNLDINIIDINGRIVYNESVQLNSGDQTININSESFATKGMYILQILNTTHGSKQVVKLLVE